MTTPLQNARPARVALARCADYAPASVSAAVREVLDPLGGMKAFVRAGQKVLLKPNLLTDREPAQAVTTHPEIVRALAREVRASGGEPFVADSPANVTKIERVWERTGFRALCEEEKIPLVSLEKAGWRAVTRDGVSFHVAQPVLDADVVISVPKIKTHMLTVYTGAVKNLYGTIPGFHKTQLHRAYPKPADFARLLTALYGTVRPALAVADAVVGMEGEGPSGGDPVALGFLGASADSVALDAALCRILRIRPSAVAYFATLRSANLGETDASRLEMAGPPWRDLAPAKFRVPTALWGLLMPARLMRWLEPHLWIRPRFTERCVSCGRCVKACPGEALRLEGKSRPVLDPARCIGCCCCHEVCPQRAVEMHMSPFMTFVRRGRLP